MNNHIQSQIEVVTIKEVEENLQHIKREYFSESELQSISSKHPQTLAGFYVTKIALKKLISKMNPNFTVSENQIILEHNSNGQPYVKKIASLPVKDLEKYFISIAHTSENAYGLATIQENMD